MSKSQYRRIKVIATERGDFVLNDDGYYVYWPKREIRGYITSHELRILADILDDMNKERTYEHLGV